MKLYFNLTATLGNWFQNHGNWYLVICDCFKLNPQEKNAIMSHYKPRLILSTSFPTLVDFNNGLFGCHYGQVHWFLQLFFTFIWIHTKTEKILTRENCFWCGRQFGLMFHKWEIKIESKCSFWPIHLALIVSRESLSHLSFSLPLPLFVNRQMLRGTLQVTKASVFCSCLLLAKLGNFWKSTFHVTNISDILSWICMAIFSPQMHSKFGSLFA